MVRARGARGWANAAGVSRLAAAIKTEIVELIFIAKPLVGRLLLTPYKNRATHPRNLQQRTPTVHRPFRDHPWTLAAGLNFMKIGHDSPKRIRHVVLGLNGYTHVRRNQ